MEETRVMKDINYSIVIPVFNAEKTISRCIKSIVNQKRDDIEVIIIDDGSTDNTAKICNSFVLSYKNIKYIYKKNEGVSIARNTGILYTDGEYTLFVDSDDYVSENLFACLDSLLAEFKYDYIVLSYYSELKQVRSSHIHSNFFSSEKTKVLKKVSDLIATKYINAPWAKAYRTDIIKRHTICFTPGVSISEDFAFNLKYTMYINNIRISSCAGYIVTLDNENSLSRGPKKDIQKQFDQVRTDYMKEFDKSDLSNSEKKILIYGLNFLEYSSIYSETKKMHLEGKSREQRKKYIRRKCKEIRKKSIKTSYSLYKFIIIFPVKFSLVSVIDFVAYRLAK